MNKIRSGIISFRYNTDNLYFFVFHFLMDIKIKLEKCARESCSLKITMKKNHVEKKPTRFGGG